jgi:hypothetical protein
MKKTLIHQIVASAILGLPGFIATAQLKTTLSVDDHRPLQSAAVQLQDRYGWLITYQDPPFAHPDDLENITPPGASAGKHMVPRKGTASVTYLEPRTGTIQEQRETVDDIVKGFDAAGFGSFRVYHNGSYSHIVPVAAKRISGSVEGVTSLCDINVSFPPATRTVDETVMLVLSQVSQRIDIPIRHGEVPMNLFLRGRYLPWQRMKTLAMFSFASWRT